MSTATTVDELSGARRRGPLAVSGAVYVVAWALGLATAPSAPDSDAGDPAIQSFYADHGSATLLQATLVHAVAGVALGVFVVLGGAAFIVTSAALAAVLALSLILLLLRVGAVAVVLSRTRAVDA